MQSILVYNVVDRTIPRPYGVRLSGLRCLIALTPHVPADGPGCCVPPPNDGNSLGALMLAVNSRAVGRNDDVLAGCERSIGTHWVLFLGVIVVAKVYDQV
jgi:hypothetical protein